MSSSGEALAAKPAGSKNPTGGRSPMRPVGFTLPADDPKEMFFFLGASLTARVAERALPLLATGAGAKAAAPARRVDTTASFMVVVCVVEDRRVNDEVCASWRSLDPLQRAYS